MKTFTTSAATIAASLALIASPVSAHSWVERASKLAPNGTMIGEVGYARGYVPRTSTDPPFSDSIPVNILPVAGQSAYSGNEILNKFKYESNPKFPMLEASPGDFIAIMHLENGHTTLPENQPNKPHNRGTIYFYGTTKAKEEEKLFDVHMLWNQEGTGGDGRGKLLATRNYDDGQCYQPNPGKLSTGRASELAPFGAKHEEELACQSDIKLPTDLKAGDVYTIYWYWDWPDLNKDKIDMQATKNGMFPWAGTFMRGQQDPNGFTMDAISRNESYSSVIDIKITGDINSLDLHSTSDVTANYIADQDIYRKGIEEQMKNNFQVDVNAPTCTKSMTSPVASPTAPIASTPAGGASDGANDGVATVTVTQTVAPPASVTTVFVTVPAGQTTSAQAPAPESTSTSTLTTTKTLFKTREPAAPSSVSEQPAGPSTSTVVLTITTRVPGGPSSVVATPEASSTPSFPGGQFRETPVTSGNEPAAPTTPTVPVYATPTVPVYATPTTKTATGPPTPSGFLRNRSNWAFGKF